MSNIFDSEEVVVSPIAVQNGKITNLTDKPNAESVFGGDGLSASELKAAFDVIGVYLAAKLSNLISALKSEEAGNSIGISGFDGNLTTVKSMFEKLSSIDGASLIGTGKTVDGESYDLQQVIDDLYRLIASYKLDDIYDIKTTLGYSRENGVCENYEALESLANALSEAVDAIETVLNLNGSGTSSIRLNNIESDVENLEGLLGKSSGIATLDMSGKLVQNVDASKIVSGKLPLSVIPNAAFERTKVVSSYQEMYALTYDDVQDGDLVVIKTDSAPDKWFKVVDDTKLYDSVGYMEIIGGTTAVAQMAKEYDTNYTGANSIATILKSLAGNGRTTESIKENAEGIEALQEALQAIKGAGYTSGSVKENKAGIASLSSEMTVVKSDITAIKSGKADKSANRLLECTHAKSGTTHTFTVTGGAFVANVTEYLVKAKMTADIGENDTFTVTDGSTTHSGVLPKTYDGEGYEAEFSSGVYPVVLFTLDVGGSEKHAFFKGGGGSYKGGYATGTLTTDDLYIPTTGLMRNYLKIPDTLNFTPRLIYLHGVNASSTMTDINANTYTFTLTDEAAIWEGNKGMSSSSKSSYLSVKSAPYEWWTVSNSSYWGTHDKGTLTGVWEAFE